MRLSALLDRSPFRVRAMAICTPALQQLGSFQDQLLPNCVNDTIGTSSVNTLQLPRTLKLDDHTSVLRRSMA
jgi:hypothetical protein